MGEVTLVFPGGLSHALAFAEQARRQGRRVIGASSIDDDPAASEYAVWEQLPYVTDDVFDDALRAVIERHSVSEIYAAHVVVWRHLSETLNRVAPGVALVAGALPVDHERAYRELRRRVAEARPTPLAGLPALHPPLSAVETAGLIRLINTIPGMCGEVKMHAAIDVMRRAPQGDIVEIGSWWGRSAALFTWLAARYGVGKVLCVDPWSQETIQQGEPLVDRVSADLDTEEAFRMFEINLAPFVGQVNYIRRPSVQAAEQYSSSLSVISEAFGATKYSGKIAVLHIDGNHAVEEVARDEKAWSRHVATGGWIIFDDYHWAYGDGPKRIADAFIVRESDRIATWATVGPAMIIKLK